MSRPGRRTPVCAALALVAPFLLGALAPDGAGAQEPPRRVRIIRSDSAAVRDSTMMRVTVDMGRIEQMIHDLIASKAMEQTIGQSLREASGQAADPKRMHALSDELARIAQKNASLITTIQMSCAHGRQAGGYIGVRIDELQTAMGDDPPAGPLLREYPKIDSVYPNSPASKAGLRRGDVVLRMGGQDARRPVPLDRLLRPMSTLPVRVQREGSARDFNLVVEKRPDGFNAECANVDQVIGPEFDQPMIFLRSPHGAQAGGVSSFVMRTGSLPEPPEPPVTGFMYGVAATNAAIAGATLMPLDDDWRATLGVDNGVLVTKVLPGTPSKDSGLRSGDVIVSADGQSVASVRSLSRIVSNATANSVKLQIIRAGKPQALVLRWQEPAPDDE